MCAPFFGKCLFPAIFSNPRDQVSRNFAAHDTIFAYSMKSDLQIRFSWIKILLKCKRLFGNSKSARNWPHSAIVFLLEHAQCLPFLCPKEERKR